MTRTEIKSTRGNMIPVLLLTADEVDAGLERRAYQAADLARAQGCRAWRILDATGRILQYGSVTSPVMSTEQAARRSGPVNDRHDW